MKDDELTDLANYFQELSRETDRGLPLVAAAVIDEKLAAALSAFMCEGKAVQRLLFDGNAPLGTFSARIDAAHALGLIDDHEYSEIGLVRKIRNLFAHSRHGLTFEDKVVAGLCTTLTSPLPDTEQYKNASARFRFMNAAVMMTMRLYYRDRWVRVERRMPKVWVTPEETGWRDFKEHLPESGAFVAIGLQGAQIGIVKGLPLEGVSDEDSIS